MITVEDSVKYWDKQWTERTEGGQVKCNQKKASILISELWARPEYHSLQKFEIGCGPAIHVAELAKYCDAWKETWTGIDVSEAAIAYAKSKGLNATVDSIYTYETHRKFQVFMILDTLEHLQHHDRVARKIISMAQKPYHIFVNIPLYQSAHEQQIERQVDVNTVAQFYKMCDAELLTVEVYGLNGYPYLMAEGKRAEDTPALP